MKIAPKVAFDIIVSEAGDQTVLPDRSLFYRTKIGGNDKIEILMCDILSNFQTMCHGKENKVYISKEIMLGHQQKSI